MSFREQRVSQAAETAPHAPAPSRLEAMLAESQRLARIGSFELDVATRRLSWSEQQFRNFGLEPAPALERETVLERLDPRDLDRHEQAVSRAIEQGEPFAIDYRVIHPGGQVVYLHTIGQPVFDAEGRVVRLIGTSQDVTERTLMQERLSAQYEQLKELDQLKNIFVDSITHELRTPLTSIMGFTELLDYEVGGPVTDSQRDFLRQIQRGARRLSSLLNDLLDVVRQEARTFRLTLASAELGELAREVIESLRPQADEMRVRIELELPDGPLVLEMDAQRIGQVLANLITNAIKFSPRGGTIRVVARRHGEGVRCEIVDAGPGIASEDLPKLFQRFSQLESGVKMGKGTGLGLSISKTLVEAHGGVIGVESTPGEGSTFWFVLPAQ